MTREKSTGKFISRKLTAASFNDLYPIGTEVRYYPIAGGAEFRQTRTRGPAWALGHGAVVVAVEGQAGGVAVAHLQVVAS